MLIRFSLINNYILSFCIGRPGQVYWRHKFEIMFSYSLALLPQPATHISPLKPTIFMKNSHLVFVKLKPRKNERSFNNRHAAAIHFSIPLFCRLLLPRHTTGYLHFKQYHICAKQENLQHFVSFSRKTKNVWNLTTFWFEKKNHILLYTALMKHWELSLCVCVCEEMGVSILFFTI